MAEFTGPITGYYFTITGVSIEAVRVETEVSPYDADGNLNKAGFQRVVRDWGTATPVAAEECAYEAESGKVDFTIGDVRRFDPELARLFAKIGEAEGAVMAYCRTRVEK